MSAEAWLNVLRAEYLQDFIRGGGAAVKFAVPSTEIDPAELNENLREVANAEGYLFASLDAAKTRVHMIDQLFHEVARQVNWSDLAFAFVSRLLTENGYSVPSDRQEFNIRRIAELNGRDERLLRTELNTLLEKNLYRDYRMCQEFRIAMIRICQAQLDPGNASPVPVEVIEDWLRGNLRRISALKPALIFQKVARNNARHMLSSLSHWSHLAGKSGVVIGLDISRCLIQRRRKTDRSDENRYIYDMTAVTSAATTTSWPDDDGRYYTKAATLDVYDALRQFVDTTDDLEFCLIVVIAPPPFLHEDGRRSVWRYNALALRIWDEVHDKNRVNPLSSLIRLSPCRAENSASEAGR